MSSMSYLYAAGAVVVAFVAVYCLTRVAASAYFAEKIAYMKRVAKEIH